MDAVRIATGVGELSVQVEGSGPPAVLWHSLFVDSTSFVLLTPLLGRQRRLVIIDGPGHGCSGPPSSLFTGTDCARAAVTVLEHLDIDVPVDWVGCAWGGHVGLDLAADEPHRLRTLTTIGTPVQALSRSELLGQAYPLLVLYRLAGPVGLIRNTLCDTLLGQRAVAAQPDLARRVMDAFSGADRSAMFTAIRSAMVHRPTFTRLDDVVAPTLVIASRDDPIWTADMARAAAAQMPMATPAVVPGEGHIAPLLTDPDLLADLICAFWAEPTEYITARALT